MLRNNEITTGFDLASTLTNEMTSGGCNDAGKIPRLRIFPRQCLLSFIALLHRGWFEVADDYGVLTLTESPLRFSKVKSSRRCSIDTHKISPIPEITLKVMPTHVLGNGTRLVIVAHLICLTWVHLSILCILIKPVVEHIVSCSYLPPARARPPLKHIEPR